MLNVSTENGKTVFDLTTPFGTNTHVTVDVVGMVEGVDYFFCNPRCAEKFRADPHKYLHKPGAPAAPHNHAAHGHAPEVTP